MEEITFIEPDSQIEFYVGIENRFKPNETIGYIYCDRDIKKVDSDYLPEELLICKKWKPKLNELFLHCPKKNN